MNFKLGLWTCCIVIILHAIPLYILHQYGIDPGWWGVITGFLGFIIVYHLLEEYYATK